MTDKDIYLQVGRMSVMGKRMPKKEIYDDNSLLTKKQKEIMEGESMSTDQYITMVEYAKYLPRGFRKLKLNYPELRDMLVSKELMKTPLDKTSGLSKGGKIAYLGNKSIITERTFSNYSK